MRYLGIDYGTKRVGIATTDESGMLAFPHSVLDNDGDLIKHITDIINLNKFDGVVIGDSKDYSGKNNSLMEDVKVFVNKLNEAIKVEIFYEPEFLTSLQATKIQGENEMLDASSATIILQSFLDRVNK